MRPMQSVRICSFRGVRIPNPPPPPPYRVMRVVRGADGAARLVKEVVTPEPPKMPRIRCDGPSKSGRGQCRAWAVGGAMYPWGASSYCARHLDEECGPVAAEGAAR